MEISPLFLHDFFFSLLSSLSSCLLTIQLRHRAIQHQRPCSGNLCPLSVSNSLACSQCSDCCINIFALPPLSELHSFFISRTHRCATVVRYTVVPTCEGLLGRVGFIIGHAFVSYLADLLIPVFMRLFKDALWRLKRSS